MAESVLMKGNEAMGEAAVRAGADFFAGYPITPSSEMLEYLSWRLPELGRSFLQAESEVSAAAMIQAASIGGARPMTVTSGPGISLMAETLNNMAMTRLCGLFIDVQRAAGSIFPEQSDYNYLTKTLGHNGLRGFVMAPHTVQEAVDLVYLSFDKGEELETPVFILSDGMIGQMEEPVVLPDFKTRTVPLKYVPPTGCGGRDPVMGRGQPMATATKPMEVVMEESRQQCWADYCRWVREEVMYEKYMMDDAEYVIVAYGSSARICKDTVAMMRERGHKVGLFRPITVYPFPKEQIRGFYARGIKGVLSVEMALPPMLLDDVRLELDQRIPIRPYIRCGGIMVDEYEAMDAMLALIGDVESGAAAGCC